jgi:hypothetical protein
MAFVALTGAPQLDYFTGGGTTIVRASTDAAPELEIQLAETKPLTLSDFVP